MFSIYNEGVCFQVTTYPETNEPLFSRSLFVCCLVRPLLRQDSLVLEEDLAVVVVAEAMVAVTADIAAAAVATEEK